MSSLRTCLAVLFSLPMIGSVTRGCASAHRLRIGFEACSAFAVPTGQAQGVGRITPAAVFLQARGKGLPLDLPVKSDSVRFAVIGDSGTGQRAQYEVAQKMAEYQAEFPFTFVTMLGDNIYGSKTPADFEVKFEQPYKRLLEAGVKFYASLGNHDDPNERYYRNFNMGGQRYYTFSKGNAQFFALDSNYMDPQQVQWLETQLGRSNSAWKICYFHHPLYSDGRYHGPDTDLRSLLGPLFLKYGVNAVFSGHEHLYERLKPQNGIYYFILGNAGALRPHDLRPSGEMVTGFDSDRCFMLVEIAGDQLYFQTITRNGDTVDHGVLGRQSKPARSALSLSPRPSHPDHIADFRYPCSANRVRVLPAITMSQRSEDNQNVAVPRATYDTGGDTRNAFARN
jgi:hypothetical protein